MEEWQVRQAGRAAFARVAANNGSAGVDHVCVAAYGKRVESEIAKLSTELREGTYRPHPLKRVIGAHPALHAKLQGHQSGQALCCK